MAIDTFKSDIHKQFEKEDEKHQEQHQKMIRDSEIMMRDEIRDAWPDQYLKVVDMVREQCTQVRDYCQTNLTTFIESANDHFKTVEKAVLNLDLKTRKDSHTQREERKEI